MARSTTTLAVACAIDDLRITVASATGFAPGNLVLIDGETMRVAKSYASGVVIPLDGRGIGSLSAAHVITANVVVGLPSDFAPPFNGGPTQTYQNQKATAPPVSFTAAGAIPLPSAGTNGVVILNGTVALAMTLAVPTTDMDGTILFIGGNGKAAHTVTVASGLGNVGATADVITFSATQQQATQLMAIGGFWCTCSTIVAGAATIAGPGLA